MHARFKCNENVIHAHTSLWQVVRGIHQPKQCQVYVVLPLFTPQTKYILRTRMEIQHKISFVQKAMLLRIVTAKPQHHSQTKNLTFFLVYVVVFVVCWLRLRNESYAQDNLILIRNAA